ncbi:MAG: right-handed parallel beta-helix repeat-containing protein [Planctomycetota bacterium]
MEPDALMLPSGAEFVAWDDRTAYTRTWHVAADAPAADDANPGTRAAPLRSLAAAAARVGPGEKVVIHAGIYRECLAPQRGGTGPDAMVAFEAAPGEQVVISAAEPWAPDWVPQRSEYRPDAPPSWYAELPVEQLIGYNPFLAANIARSEWFPWQHRPLEELRRAQLRRGMILQDGRPLRQSHGGDELGREDGWFHVSDDGLRVRLRPWGDCDPAAVTWELSVRMQCVAPAQTDLGWIALRGLTCRHAANGCPFPQRGAISTTAGHHWLIEDCTVEDANALGMDLGYQNEVRPSPRRYTRGDQTGRGGHIVRRNRIRRCGLAGIAGVGNVDGALIAGNRIEDIGHLGLEHVYEAAAIKLHGVRGALIRDNLCRRLRDCCGIWLDHCCVDNRVTGNLVHDVVTVLAGIYVEVSVEPNLVDHNLVWDLRDAENNDPPKDDTPGGIGIAGDMTDFTLIRDNCLCEIRGYYAISLHLAQKGRLVFHRTAMCRGHEVTGNCLIRCSKRIYAARPDHMVCDHNLYDSWGPIGRRGGRGSFAIPEPDREARLDLGGWQRFLGLDREGSEGHIPLAIVATEDGVRIQATGDLPASVPAYFGQSDWCRLRAGEALHIAPTGQTA